MTWTRPAPFTDIEKNYYFPPLVVDKAHCVAR